MSARERGGWSAYRLPRIRRDLAGTYGNAAADLPGMAKLSQTFGTGDFTEDDARELLTEARQLRAADLYWVTPDMTRVALAASGDLPEWTPAAARPSTFGLLMWDGGLPHLSWRGAPDKAWTTNAIGARVPPTVTVDGVAWAPHPSGVVLTLMTRTLPLLDGWLTDRWANIDVFPFGRIELSLLDPVPTTSQDWSSGLVAALGATWLLMMQPTVAESRPLHEQAESGPGGRRDRPDREVRLIDLRRAVAAPAADRDDDSASGRTYQHRWVVRAHWRQQAVGRGRSQRRPTFVPAYVKGPDGAPLLETDHVHVWRR